MERYEFKYLVPERLVPAIRATARSVGRADKYANEDGSYRIRSLYFDTRGHDLYWANAREQRDRFKVRARTYPGKKSPVFLEVKRRVQDVIIKSRACVPADEWRELVERGNPAALERLAPGVRKGAEKFIGAIHRHDLRPTVLVDYEREAYESTLDRYARITFDRRVVCQRKEALDLEASDRGWRPVDHPVQTNTHEPVCVLELKFERRPPAWMVALVRRLELVRRSFSKYCYSVNAQLMLPDVRSARIEGGPLP
ncbi:polyphosphate polymerase domain-containing protein [Sorangium cellulosum]|uniref:polyphosphate polymerase domain-containing protein n=1 Tax=Sorangium cellulosum TaxID=56 RepID=UPI0009B82943|nr:polyphosphate polymerase domain-containing protein [Sorangium cellulosum]